MTKNDVADFGIRTDELLPHSEVAPPVHAKGEDARRFSKLLQDGADPRAEDEIKEEMTDLEGAPDPAVSSSEEDGEAGVLRPEQLAAERGHEIAEGLRPEVNPEAREGRHPEQPEASQIPADQVPGKDGSEYQAQDALPQYPEQSFVAENTAEQFVPQGVEQEVVPQPPVPEGPTAQDVQVTTQPLFAGQAQPPVNDLERRSERLHEESVSSVDAARGRSSGVGDDDEDDEIEVGHPRGAAVAGSQVMTGGLSGAETVATPEPAREAIPDALREIFEQTVDKFYANQSQPAVDGTAKMSLQLNEDTLGGSRVDVEFTDDTCTISFDPANEAMGVFIQDNAEAFAQSLSETLSTTVTVEVIAPRPQNPPTGVTSQPQSATRVTRAPGSPTAASGSPLVSGARQNLRPVGGVDDDGESGLDA